MPYRGDGRIRDIPTSCDYPRFQPIFVHLARLEIHAAAARWHVRVLLDAFAPLALPRIQGSGAAQNEAARAHGRAGPIWTVLRALECRLAARPSRICPIHNCADPHGHDAVLCRYALGALGTA